jgi:hypothetical protein
MIIPFNNLGHNTIVPAPGDYDVGEFGGMKIGRGNRNTRRKPAPAPICPPQIPLDQTRIWTRAAAVGSQRLTSKCYLERKINLTMSDEKNALLEILYYTAFHKSERVNDCVQYKS